jgi:hypothetical protein
MKHIAMACLGLALAGCSTADGTPMVFDGTLAGAATELASPGSSYRARQAADNLKCREYGLVPDTAAFGDCLLTLEQARS